MNKSQLKHIEMFNTVLQYLEQNRFIWEGNKSISDLIINIRERTRMLMDKMRRQSAPTFGATQETQQMRLELEMAILQIATQLALFAIKIGDRELAAQCQVAPSILGVLSREALGWMGERIQESILEHQAALLEFGVTEADVNGLQSLLQKFQEAKTAPRRAIADRSRETTTLPEWVRAISRLFRLLDRLMTRFQPAHPEFFAGYLTVRVVIDRRHTVPKAPPTPGPAAQPKAESEAEPKA